jgi:hypothetical protein
MNDPSSLEPGAPTPEQLARRGGCILWPITILVGFFFASLALSLPIAAVTAPTATVAALVVVVDLALCLFLGYALRGLVRALRGAPDANLIPPSLVRPIAFGLGALSIVTGLAAAAGVWAGQSPHSAGRAIGLGIFFVCYGAFGTRYHRAM